MKYLLILLITLYSCHNHKCDEVTTSCGMEITTQDNQHLTFTDPCIQGGLMVDVYAYDQLVPPLTFFEVDKTDSMVSTYLIQKGYDIDMGTPSNVQWHFYMEVYQLNSGVTDTIGPFTY